MKLLITMRTTCGEYNEPRHAISFDWISLCQRLGFTPILIPCGLEDYSEYFALNPLGLLLTGGDSVGTLAQEPEGAQPTQRDITEHQLIEQAIQRSLPILGVCRGMQILNTFFGGSLLRQLKANHVGFHDVIFAKSAFGYACGDKIKVNSFHHHGFYEPQLAENFEIIARSSEGCIECIEHKNLPITGILWHPERENEAARDLDTLIIHSRFHR